MARIRMTERMLLVYIRRREFRGLGLHKLLPLLFPLLLSQSDLLFLPFRMRGFFDLYLSRVQFPEDDREYREGAKERYFTHGEGACELQWSVRDTFQDTRIRSSNPQAKREESNETRRARHHDAKRHGEGRSGAPGNHRTGRTCRLGEAP